MLGFAGKRSLAAVAGMSLALAGLVAITPTAAAAAAKEACGTGTADKATPGGMLAGRRFLLYL